MKTINSFYLAIILVFTSTIVTAQNENNPWLISIGVNAVDTYPTNVGDSHFMGQSWWTDEFFNATDHWNIFPASVFVSRYLGSNISLGAHATYNKIDKVGDASMYLGKPVDDFAYYGIDGFFKYSFTNGKKLEPFVKVGGGYSWIDDIGAGTLNGGVGFNYWISEKVGINVQSTYKHSFEDYLIPHFQHNVGISYRFGSKDTDGDGISDGKDECPEVFGLKEFNGCPDSDGDGLPDNKDNCPNEAGDESNGGCPAIVKDVPPVKETPVKETETPKEEKPTTATKENIMKKVVYFGFDSTTLTSEAHRVLDEVVSFANKGSQYTIEVDGFADSVGNSDYNMELSKKRAENVKQYLISKGLSASTIKVEANGENQPVASNDTAEGRNQNRRAELVIVVRNN